MANGRDISPAERTWGTEEALGGLSEGLRRSLQDCQLWTTRGGRWHRSDCLRYMRRSHLIQQQPTTGYLAKTDQESHREAGSSPFESSLLTIDVYEALYRATKTPLTHWCRQPEFLGETCKMWGFVA